MASLIGLASSPFPTQTSQLLPSRSNSISSLIQLKRNLGRRLFLLRVNCSSRQVGDAETESESKVVMPNTSADTSISAYNCISAYNWCAALGGIGFLETSYLTYLKLTNSEAFCPVGDGGSCGDILNSSYSAVFGVPLPLIGMIAYGVVAVLGIQLGQKSRPVGIGEANGRLVLLGTSTSMAAASAYFLYILSTKFTGEFCPYCLASVLLSFGLFISSIKGSGFQEVQKDVGIQLLIVLMVVSTLNNSYSASQPTNTSSAMAELEYFTTEITSESTPFAISLAKHLRSVGAKMYGAFWCSHCQEQKQMFGREAAKLLDYVECFPDGFKKGTYMVKACQEAKLEGFPTWVINGEVLSGEKKLSELAELSGFDMKELTEAK
ncbi:ribosome biosynthesis protein lto1 [Datura stramonium]|uniref:Ribosome biosynthesis protein lto1 n=1 Tax=Datura stramonium TaxID=4076 RepID=A0ABS8SRJ9_DATST|nr:ribosome biosynthesis protein lto1 [Datura stramonium]